MSELEQQVQDLQRELIAAQEMLAFFLVVNQGRVTVPKSALVKGIPANSEIVINDDIAGDQFVFTLEQNVEH